ncbi:UNVERIFIED_ORG: beta-phosphoglucomutase-like phosphatase (HAD superfamily) [Actinomadura viridilutea]
MYSTLRCAGVLFDCDGVLVHSQRVSDRILGEWAANHGLDTQKTVELSRGRRDVELVRMVAPWLDADEEARLLEERELLELDGLEEVPGARRLLDGLPADRWAVVTSGSGTLVRNRLRAAGLPEPRVVISADDVREGKPHPEGYLTAAVHSGSTPQTAWSSRIRPPGSPRAPPRGLGWSPSSPRSSAPSSPPTCGSTTSARSSHSATAPTARTSLLESVHRPSPEAPHSSWGLSATPGTGGRPIHEWVELRPFFTTPPILTE